MSVRRRVFFGSVVSLLVVTQLLIAPTISGSDQWVPTVPSSLTPEVTLGVSDQTNVEPMSFIEGQIPKANNGKGSQADCSTYPDIPDCEFGAAGEIVGASILFPVCRTASQTNCLASLSLGTSAATLQAASFLRSAPGITVAADPSQGLPEGATPQLWQSAVTNAGGTSTYETSVELDFTFRAGKFVPLTFSATIQPYTQESGPDYTTPATTEQTEPDGNQILVTPSLPQGCAWEESGDCGIKEDFAPDTFASLSIRITKGVVGWFFGRMEDPSLQSEPFDATSNLVTVTGESASVPSVEISDVESNFTPAVQRFIALKHISSNDFVIIPPSFGVAPTLVDDLRNEVNNTATAVTNVWNVSSISSSLITCGDTAKEIQGIVTTNALAYDGDVPTFTKGYFSYGVAGMHYLPGGNVAHGTYDMIISDAEARCLYGFSNAPISATISVTEDSGVEDVATTNVSDNGHWIHLSADGFTFSNPVIRIKLKQSKATGKSH